LLIIMVFAPVEIPMLLPPERTIVPVLEAKPFGDTAFVALFVVGP
jgi:hypothetical protein